MAALGLSMDRDGWRFEPTSGETAKFVLSRPGHSRRHAPSGLRSVCRGDRRRPPADDARPPLLCTADGLKVFFCRRFALSLVPDWPLATRPDAIPDDVGRAYRQPRRRRSGAISAPCWPVPGGRRRRPSDPCTRPSTAGERCRACRPGPPYLCVSRIVSVDCPPARPTEGAHLTAEFDVDPEAWYFRDNPDGTMPYCVLLEAILQPCGWLGSYMGFAHGGRRGIPASETWTATTP